ncbi:MAG TPA: hypothetical protein VKB76_16980 [Ktedonobacterales bacterium]|nr:hypothetical protein [Ktedonobacterales bacterium]
MLDVLPGAIIDAVTALYFTQAQETRRRATELYDRLREDNKQDGALDLADSIRDESICSVVKAHLALHLAGIDNPDLAMIVAAAKPPSAQSDKEDHGKRLPASEANM